VSFLQQILPLAIIYGFSFQFASSLFASAFSFPHERGNHKPRVCLILHFAPVVKSSNLLREIEREKLGSHNQPLNIDISERPFHQAEGRILGILNNEVIFIMQTLPSQNS
jgi:hypothetical protein